MLEVSVIGHCERSNLETEEAEIASPLEVDSQ